MRILNRPMFRYGGPIKEGIMHGMRNGGRAAALVGNPVYPKTDGREHHFWNFALQGAARALPYVSKAWKYIKPTAKFRHPAVTQHPGASFKYTPAPYSAKEIAKNPKIWGQAIKENPGWTTTGVLAAYNAPGTYEAAKGAGGLGWKAVKQAADLAVPDWIWDQDKWEAERAKKKLPPTNIMKPGGDPGPSVPDIPEPKKKTPAELAAEAKAARTKKLNKYLDTMGYDKAKKTAIGDALIDASAIVQQGTEEAGSLKHANWSKMINQAIQATSQRLKKPEQIREAVGLMMTKADIQKDMNADEKALAKLLTSKKIQKLNKELEGNSFRENLIAITQKMPGQAGFDAAAQVTEGVDFKGNLINATDWTESLKKMQEDPTSTGLNEKQLIKLYAEKEIAGKGYEDGDYTVGNNLVTIKDDIVVAVE